MNLVVGSTGLLGSTICLQLAKAGKPVSGLVRDTSSEKAKKLSAAGVHLVLGDLKDAGSLERAVAGVHTVICTASSTFSRREGDSIETVDHLGVLSLIAAAERGGVRSFVFVSFDAGNDDSPLSRAKHDAEERLKASKLNWTILQPALFCEVWLSPALGFDAAGGKAVIYGAGDRNVGYIAVEDVAKTVVACIGNASASRQVFTFGGPVAASQLDAVHTYERVTGRKFAIERMPLDVITQSRRSESDPMKKSFFSLMQHVAEGFRTDPNVLTKLGVRAQTLEDWVRTKVGN